MDSSDDDYENKDLGKFMYKAFIDSSDLDDENAEMMLVMRIQEEMKKQVERVLRFKGSIKGRRVVLQDMIAHAQLLCSDYFKLDPTYHEVFFRHRFRMSKHLFLHIVNAMVEYDPYFKPRKDCCEQLSFAFAHL